MNEEKYLIIDNKNRNRDITSNVASIRIGNSMTEVKFLSGKICNYNNRNITVFNRSQKVKLKDNLVICDGIPFTNVKLMLRFGDIYKVFFENGLNRIYECKQIEFDKNLMIESEKYLLNYYSKIAKLNIIKDLNKSVLYETFRKVSHIGKESILNSYFKNIPPINREYDTKNIIFPFRVSLSQREAILTAMSNNICVIEGPPGTGKTQTILNIISNLAIMNDKSVAIVSNNNSAIENVHEKLTNNGYGSIVASLGKSKKRKNFLKQQSNADIDKFKNVSSDKEMWDELEKINSKLTDLLAVNNEIKIITQKIQAYKLEQRYFEDYLSKQDFEKIKSLPFYKKSSDRIVKFMVDYYALKYKKGFLEVIHKIKLFVKYRYFDNNTIDSEKYQLVLNLQKDYYELKIQELNKRLKLLNRKLVNIDFEELLKKHQLISKIILEEKLYQKISPVATARFSSINGIATYNQLLKRYPVIISTTHSLLNCMPQNFMFDYVIVDESSQVDLVTGVMAMSAAKNIIVVGDIKQLPPIVDKDIKANLPKDDIQEEYHYEKQSLLSSLVNIYGEKLSRVWLKEHFRCHPNIINFCNKKYYSNKLIAYTDNIDSEMLNVYHTSKGNHARKIYKGLHNGRYSQRELDIAKSIIDTTEINKQKEIGFISPYRLQANKAISLFGKEVECDTVHKFQGREKSMIILSTVLDNNADNEWYDVGSFVDNPNLINVAVSRAINRFVLITDNSYFTNYGTEVRDLIRYIKYSTYDEGITESPIISVFDLLYKDYSEKLEPFRKRLHGKSKYKSEKIIETIICDILLEEKYNMLTYTFQVYVKNLIDSSREISLEEEAYVKNNASVDFVIYHQMDNQIILVIEVDGTFSHENNSKQQNKDKLKNNVLKTYEIPYLRLPTNSSDVKYKITEALENVLGKMDED